jgi:hypothetical protein
MCDDAITVNFDNFKTRPAYSGKKKALAPEEEEAR